MFIGGGQQGAGRFGDIESGPWRPPLDIYERDDAIVVVLELAGLKREQIDVRVEQGVLRIAGTRPKWLPDSTRRVHQMEIPYGPFMQKLALPRGARVDAITAEYADGYLTVEIPLESRS
jgi:HSP20 family protein